MQSTFDGLGGTYRQEGDYLLPDVEVPGSPAIGIWGQRRHKHLKNITMRSIRRRSSAGKSL